MNPIKKSAVGLSAFTLRRSGVFTQRTNGATHCGTTPILTVRYTLSVTCTVTSLDTRGFLFDQTNIDAFFQRVPATLLSCEALTVHYGRALYKQIIRENTGCHIQRFSLTLSPAPHAAELTFEYGE
jgi:hypothetical protein